jgi:site-specific DNA-methyltransferase (adenine-specific)
MTRLNRGLFTSLRGDWKTPRALYQALDAEFHFDYDPCPSKHIENGLETEWGNVNFLNPPYGKEITKWIQKGYEESLKGKTVVL